MTTVPIARNCTPKRVFSALAIVNRKLCTPDLLANRPADGSIARKLHAFCVDEIAGGSAGCGPQWHVLIGTLFFEDHLWDR
jgi:hypothetical protein